jgi:hypothetical protein
MRAVEDAVPRPVGHVLSVGMGPHRRWDAGAARACSIGAVASHLRPFLVGSHGGGAQRPAMGPQHQHCVGDLLHPAVRRKDHRVRRQRAAAGEQQFRGAAAVVECS